jgi:succinate-semialdehyde dehydrogenase/glutarate-semialdehyde dehydrogenase
MPFVSINPTTGKELKRFPEISTREMTQTIEKTNQAFLSWRNVSFAERAKKLKKASEILKKNSEKYQK